MGTALYDALETKLQLTEVQKMAMYQRTATFTVAARRDSSQASIDAADCVCDGTADDVQIQAVIDALKTTGGTIVLAEGSYSCSDSISMELHNWTRRVRILAYGAQLTYSKTSGYAFNLNQNHYSGTFYKDSLLNIEGLVLVGNASCDGGILLDRAQMCSLIDMRITDFKNTSAGYGVRITDSGSDSAEYNIIRDCYIWNNMVGILDDTTNSAANTRIEDTDITTWANTSGTACGFYSSGVFSRCRMQNVSVHMGNANNQIAYYFNGPTYGTYLDSCAMDDHGSTATGQNMIYIGSSATDGLVLTNFSYASSNTNLVPYYTEADDFTLRFHQADITRGESGCDENIFPDGTFESGIGWLTESNITASVDSGTLKVGDQSLKLVNADAGGAGAVAYYELPWYARYKGLWITLSAWVRCDSGNTQPQSISIWDGVGAATYTPTLAKDSTWHYIELRKKVSASATRLRINFIGNNVAAVDTDDQTWVSGVQINEGLNANTFKPMNHWGSTPWHQSGTDSIASGTTSQVVAHGCATTPTKINISFREQGTNDYGRWWVDTIGATNFTLNVTGDPGASNLDFDWEAIVR